MSRLLIVIAIETLIIIGLSLIVEDQAKHAIEDMYHIQGLQFGLEICKQRSNK